MTKTILIVDDNPPTLKLLAGIVAGAGYEVAMAQSGAEALTLATAHKFDCALIDQYMDPMDGFTLVRRLRLEGHIFPMAMITANESNDLLLQARKNGLVTIMMKPVDPARLLKLVEKMTR